jgi:uncharacterized protein YidB (DUF937 family)
MLGGLLSGEMATVVSGLIEKHGGVQGVVTQMQQQGLGAKVGLQPQDLAQKLAQVLPQAISKFTPGGVVQSS